MEPRLLRYIATGCDGALVHGDPGAQISGIATDSRRVASGDLFFALAGEKFNGHDFLAEASRKAAGLVIEHKRKPARLPDLPVITVENTRRALGMLAKRYREDFS